MEQTPDSAWDELVTDVINEISHEDEALQIAVADSKEFLQDWWRRYLKASENKKFSAHVDLDRDLSIASKYLEEIMRDIKTLDRHRLELELGMEPIEARRLVQSPGGDFYPDDAIMLPARSSLLLTYAHEHQNGHVAADMPTESAYYSLTQLYIGSEEFRKVVPIFKAAQVVASGGDLRLTDSYSPAWPFIKPEIL
jgi:hypothetical protein